MYCCAEIGDRHAAYFGLYQQDSKATDINLYCDFIDKLSDSSHKLWESCTRIDFNIAYEAGDEVNKGRSPIPTEILSRIAKHSGDIMITIYLLGTYRLVTQT